MLLPTDANPSYITIMGGGAVGGTLGGSLFSGAGATRASDPSVSLGMRQAFVLFEFFDVNPQRNGRQRRAKTVDLKHFFWQRGTESLLRVVKTTVAELGV